MVNWFDSLKTSPVGHYSYFHCRLCCGQAMMIVRKSPWFLLSAWISFMLLVQGGSANKGALANVHLCMMYVFGGFFFLCDRDVFRLILLLWRCGLLLGIAVSVKKCTAITLTDNVAPSSAWPATSQYWARSIGPQCPIATNPRRLINSSKHCPTRVETRRWAIPSVRL